MVILATKILQVTNEVRVSDLQLGTRRDGNAWGSKRHQEQVGLFKVNEQAANRNRSDSLGMMPHVILCVPLTKQREKLKTSDGSDVRC